LGLRVLGAKLLDLARLDNDQASDHGLGDRPLVDGGEAEGTAVEIAPRPGIRKKAEFVCRLLRPRSVDSFRCGEYWPCLDVGSWEEVRRCRTSCLCPTELSLP
jgi:hypothetical protein